MAQLYRLAEECARRAIDPDDGVVVLRVRVGDPKPFTVEATCNRGRRYVNKNADVHEALRIVRAAILANDTEPG